MAINTDPSTQQHTIVVVCIVSSIVTSIFVAIRMWTRVFVIHSVGWDDYIALLTLPFCIGYSVLIGLGTNCGFGWHTTDMSPEGYIMYLKWIYISSIIYLFALGLYKTTILLLYLRLFGVNKPFNKATWAVMIFVFSYLLCNLLTLLFGCTPISKYWDQTLPGHCISEQKAGLAYGSLNFVSDAVIFVLPLPMIWRLQLSRESKLGVTLVFMGGVMASVVALIRYIFLLRRYYATDIIWYDGRNLLWMVLEVHTGLICSCTFAFKPFYKRVASSSYFSRTSSPSKTSHAKNDVPLRAQRSDSGPLVQNRGGVRGFVVLGDEETEMDGSRGGGVEVEGGV